MPAPKPSELREAALRLLPELGVRGTARQLGVSRSTVSEWARRPVRLADSVSDGTAVIVEPQDTVRSPEFEHQGERPEEHQHDPDDPEAVLVFDLHGTLTATNGFPLDIRPPFPGVKEGMDRMAARGCCIHIATAGLDELDEMVNSVRYSMIRAWCDEHALPVSHIGPKQNAHVYYDDRMIAIDSDHATTDWPLYWEEAEALMLEKFDLEDGRYARKPREKTGTPIEVFPDIDEVPTDHPRGFTTPVLEVDVHRCISYASGSQRTAPLKPGAKAAIQALYHAGYTIQVGCAGWNPATHSKADWEGRYAAQGQYLYDQGVPFDRRVSKDHGDLFFDDKGLRHTDWAADWPALLEALHREAKGHNIPLYLAENAMPTGAMVAFYPSPGEAEQLAQAGEGAEPARQLHLTLAYLGKAADVGDPAALRAALAQFAATQAPVTGSISGLGRFNPSEADKGAPVYASLDAPKLPAFREALASCLEHAGYPADATHGFTPHITLGYGIDMPEAVPQLTITFPAVILALGPELSVFPLAAFQLAEKTDQPLSVADARKRRRAGDQPSPEKRSRPPSDLERGGAATAENENAPSTPPTQSEHKAREAGNQEGSKGEASARAAGLETGVKESVVSALGTQPADRPEGLSPADLETHDHPVLNRLWLEAFQRYANLANNGVARHHSLAAVQKIDPDFYIEEEEHAWLLNAIAERAKNQKGTADDPSAGARDTKAEPGLPTLHKMVEPWPIQRAMHAFDDSNWRRPELLLMGWSPGQPTPPPHVLNVYDRYEMTPSQIDALSSQLSSDARAYYLEGVNAHLAAAGLPAVGSISDPAILSQLDVASVATAAGIADTYNRQLANRVYGTWITQRSELGRQSSDYHLATAVDQWAQQRADWKGQQIATAEATRWSSQAGQDFAANNPQAVQTAHVEPADTADCDGCQELVDLGSIAIEDAALLDLPLHPNCPHQVVYDIDPGWSPGGDYWAAQGPAGDAMGPSDFPQAGAVAPVDDSALLSGPLPDNASIPPDAFPEGGVPVLPDPTAWDREWVQGEHGGASYTTPTAIVDVVNPSANPDAERIFVGGSRGVKDLESIMARVAGLPQDSILVTSRTFGASAAIRKAALDTGRPMEVWTARFDQFPTHEAAYFARDEEMIRSANRIVEFWDGTSKGTAHEIEYARQLGKDIDLIRVDPASALPQLERDRQAVPAEDLIAAAPPGGPGSISAEDAATRAWIRYQAGAPIDWTATDAAVSNLLDSSVVGALDVAGANATDVATILFKSDDDFRALLNGASADGVHLHDGTVLLNDRLQAGLRYLYDPDAVVAEELARRAATGLYDPAALQTTLANMITSRRALAARALKVLLHEDFHGTGMIGQTFGSGYGAESGRVLEEGFNEAATQQKYAAFVKGLGLDEANPWLLDPGMGGSSYAREVAFAKNLASQLADRAGFKSGDELVAAMNRQLGPGNKEDFLMRRVAGDLLDRLKVAGDADLVMPGVGYSGGRDLQAMFEADLMRTFRAQAAKALKPGTKAGYALTLARRARSQATQLIVEWEQMLSDGARLGTRAARDAARAAGQPWPIPGTGVGGS